MCATSANRDDAVLGICSDSVHSPPLAQGRASDSYQQSITLVTYAGPTALLYAREPGTDWGEIGLLTSGSEHPVYRIYRKLLI
jgi:hypothetical protein